MDLAKGANLKLDRSLVPESLAHLIQMVERWGFDSLDDQDLFVEQLRIHYPADIIEFNTQIDPHLRQIVDWGRTLEHLEKPTSELTAADWAHPYWSFLAAFKIREITGPQYTPTLSDLQNDSGWRAERCRQLQPRAAELFRAKDYQGYVEVLSPYADILSPVEAQKLAIARRKAAGNS